MPAKDNAPPISTIQFQLGQQKLFTGNLSGIAASVDQRLRFAKSMHDLAEQGVKFINGRLKPEDLPDLTSSYNLIIDATGKAGPLAPFPVETGTHSLPSASAEIHRWLFYRSTALRA
ncbi:hypothetical protein [Paenibacillus sp. ISL-20]|uniref:hypothetical protein n=1 Tax=Paenibacillus sp. ISL-20 TaxID=2819163 RepID=UPI001BE9DA35|nr:hypothetical protein [Paenibacillus sp. ISL-20]MBT2763551.1 hypothetical protein [Paenibacillus sp. ISL-20]